MSEEEKREPRTAVMEYCQRITKFCNELKTNMSF